MVLSRLTSRLRGAVTRRLPSRPSIPRPSPPSWRPSRPSVSVPELPVETPDVDVVPGIEEGDGDKLTLGLTVVALTGLGLTTIGVVGRVLVDRLRARGDTAEPAAESDTETVDVSVESTAETDEPPVEATPDSTETETVTTATRQSTLETDTTADTADSPDSPRIAPLVGMVALVGIRLVVEKVDDETVEDTA